MRRTRHQTLAVPLLPALLLLAAAVALPCVARDPDQQRSTAPVAGTDFTIKKAGKLVADWNEADWSAFGASVAKDPAVQKLPPLERAKYIVDQVGAKYDQAGMLPNVNIWGRARSGVLYKDPANPDDRDVGRGSCGDLTLSVKAALNGAQFQTGDIAVRQSDSGAMNWFNAHVNILNVNSDHGAPIVVVDGKKYVMDLWLHGGDTRGWFDRGHFSGFKDSAFTMPQDDWVAVMKDNGYIVDSVTEPPNAKVDKKSDDKKADPKAKAETNKTADNHKTTSEPAKSDPAKPTTTAKPDDKAKTDSDKIAGDKLNANKDPAAAKTAKKAKKTKPAVTKPKTDKPGESEDEPDTEPPATPEPKTAAKPGITTVDGGYVSDKNGKIGVTYTRDPNGNDILITYTTYDPNGNVVRTQIYGPDGKLMSDKQLEAAKATAQDASKNAARLPPTMYSPHGCPGHLN